MLSRVSFYILVSLSIGVPAFGQGCLVCVQNQGCVRRPYYVIYQCAPSGNNNCIFSQNRCPTTVSSSIQQDPIQTSETILTPLNSETAPLVFDSATTGSKNILISAVVRNVSGKSIAKYRIGWIAISSVDNSFRAGLTDDANPNDLSSDLSIGNGQDISVPEQNMPSVLAENARVFGFFIAEVKFSDGSLWNIPFSEPYKELSHLASLNAATNVSRATMHTHLKSEELSLSNSIDIP